MGLHTDLPVYRDAKALMVLAAELSKNFPRPFRRVAEKLNDGCIEIMMSIFHANVATDKVPHIDALREHLEVVKLTLQLALELRLVSKSQWASTAEYTGSIGKQTTGWLKSASARLNHGGQGRHG